MELAFIFLFLFFRTLGILPHPAPKTLNHNHICSCLKVNRAGTYISVIFLVPSKYCNNPVLSSIHYTFCRTCREKRVAARLSGKAPLELKLCD